MDSGDYATIYDTSTRGFKAAVSRDVWIAFLTRINRKMGSCEAAPATFGGMQVSTTGTFVTTVSSRRCKNGKLNERFVWLVVGDSVGLLKYNGSSPLLLTD